MRSQSIVSAKGPTTRRPEQGMLGSGRSLGVDASADAPTNEQK